MKETATIIAVLLNLASVYFIYAYLDYRAREEKGLKIFFLCRKNTRLIVLNSLVGTASFIVFIYSLYIADVSLLKSFLNMLVFILIAAMAYIDWMEQIIPNQLILVGLLLWIIVTVMEICLGGTPVKSVLFFSLLGAGVCGGILLVVALISKGALGMGDVKMFTVLGLLYGMVNTYSILIFTVIFMAIISIVLVLMKKITMKSKVPMAPFVILGFIVGVLAGM